MNLYISASNRKHNSYNLLNKLRNGNDIFLSLADLDIKYCIGCNACQKNEGNQCVLKDDMNQIYNAKTK